MQIDEWTVWQIDRICSIRAQRMIICSLAPDGHSFIHPPVIVLMFSIPRTCNSDTHGYLLTPASY